MNTTLPDFSKVNPSTLKNDLDALLVKNREAIEQRLEKGEPFNWENFIEPIEEMSDALHQFWAPVSHLNAVVNSEALREAYNQCLPLLSDYASALSHNVNYFKAIESIAESADYQDYDFAQKKLIEHELRDFKLSGVALPEAQKKQFAELSKKLSQLTTKFEENLLDATHAWTKLVTDEKELSGLPTHAVESAKEAAEKTKQNGWLFTLEAPSLIAILTYADSQKLRQELYEAHVTRASDQGPTAGKWDNSNIMADILKTRLELATLLGFHNYAEYSLATKMVPATQEVLNFLNQLAEASHQKATEEFNALSEFAKNELKLEKLEAWDIGYASEKLRQSRYAISQEELRPYFPEHKVLEGLFAIVKKLFNLTITPVKNASVWHPDAQCFAIHRGETLVSYFYLDLYAREHKRGGAWMDDCQSHRHLANGTIQKPIAFIVCNFNRPVGNKPALFSHDDVVTLFHEFGHALQHMLTTIKYSGVSGINGIPWDAVEICSQLMENFAWQKESLLMASEHVESKAPLPDELFQKLYRARNFQAAMQMMRQLEFALFDFRLHMEFSPSEENQIQTILDAVRNQVRVVPIAKADRFQHGFSHIFAGGYAAGYYSYKWAEVMAQDAFSVFKEQGIFNQQISDQFRETFLEMGGAQEPLDLFVKFRGRKPNVDALLIDSGIIAE